MKSYNHLYENCISEENRRISLNLAKHSKRMRRIMKSRHLSDDALVALSYDWINNYENAFAAIPLLVSFIPMLMDTGGNCGSQSSTLIIRGLALSQIQFRDIFKVVFKEFRISLIVGSVLAVSNGIRIMIQYGDPSLALVIALSLVGTVVISKMIGCMLPLLASRVHLDPALMASPLITTLVDIFSILIYFNIATHLFNL